MQNSSFLLTGLGALVNDDGVARKAGVDDLERAVSFYYKINILQ